MSNMKQRADTRKAILLKINELFDDPAADDGVQHNAAPLPRRKPDDGRPWWKRGTFLRSDEEWALAWRWRVRNDRAAADRIVTAHLPLIAARAAKFPSVRHDDAMSDGVLGALAALSKFNPDLGTFRTYAIPWIDGEIRRGARRARSVVRHPKSALSLNDSALNAKVRAGSPVEIQDLLVAKDVDPEDAKLAHWEVLLSEALNALSYRERRIFEARRLAEPRLMLETLAREFDISRERVRQIEEAALTKIRATIYQSATKLEVERRATTSSNVADGLDPWRRYRMLIDKGFSPELALESIGPRERTAVVHADSRHLPKIASRHRQRVFA